VKSTFIDGLRVTDSATMEVAEMVLSGAINKEIANWITLAGGEADVRGVGLSGKDARLITVEKVTRTKKDPDSLIEQAVDLGFVGEPTKIDPQLIPQLIHADHDYIPVIAPIAVGDDGETVERNRMLTADTGFVAAPKKIAAGLVLDGCSFASGHPAGTHADVAGSLQTRKLAEKTLETVAGAGRVDLDVGRADSGNVAGHMNEFTIGDDFRVRGLFFLLKVAFRQFGNRVLTQGVRADESQESFSGWRPVGGRGSEQGQRGQDQCAEDCCERKWAFHGLVIELRSQGKWEPESCYNCVTR
jgi:hypothetical protein